MTLLAKTSISVHGDNLVIRPSSKDEQKENRLITMLVIYYMKCLAPTSEIDEDHSFASQISIWVKPEKQVLHFHYRQIWDLDLSFFCICRWTNETDRVGSLTSNSCRTCLELVWILGETLQIQFYVKLSELTCSYWAPFAVVARMLMNDAQLPTLLHSYVDSWTQSVIIVCKLDSPQWPPVRPSCQVTQLSLMMFISYQHKNPG